MQLTAQAEAKVTGLNGAILGENPGTLNDALDFNGKAAQTAQVYQMALIQQQMLQNYSP
jgi:hypothetical protein